MPSAEGYQSDDFSVLCVGGDVCYMQIDLMKTETERKKQNNFS